MLHPWPSTERVREPPHRWGDVWRASGRLPYSHPHPTTSRTPVQPFPSGVAAHRPGGVLCFPHQPDPSGGTTPMTTLRTQDQLASFGFSEAIPIGELEIDDTYQRPPNPLRVNRIAENYDPSLFGVIEVD